MSAPAFLFSEDELNKAGLLGEGEYLCPFAIHRRHCAILTFVVLTARVSEYAAMALDIMKQHPELLRLSLFALECINLQGQRGKDAGSRRLPNFPTLSHQSMSSHLSALSFAGNVDYVPDEYERTTYYNGITGDGDHPELVYRSDFLTTPFPKPTRNAHVPVRSLRGVFGTPLNSVWHTVGPQIRDLVKARKVHWSSIDPARFLTHGPPGEERGTLGPVVIWVGVKPRSTTPETAHDISQQILALLRTNGVDDVVVEWREAEPQTLAGSPLLRHVGTGNATHHVRHFLTALLGVPLATEEMEDSQGILTLWFHENRDKNGDPSNKVYGVSNCHVLCKDTTVKYEHKVGAAKKLVRVCSMRRFQRGLDDITTAVSDHSILATYWAGDIAKLQAKQEQDPETAREIRRLKRNLEQEDEAIADLEALHDEVTKHWSDITLRRNIGYVQYAPAIRVDQGGTSYTSDWAAFVAAEAKVKDQFEGNVVDLGSKYPPQALTKMFYPIAGGATTFKFPEERKLRIEGCATEGDLANPAERDSEGEGCLLVGKDGNTTGLTVGRYAGLASFAKNDAGVESIELGIYNAGDKTAEVFSAKGDSGSLVWYIKDGKAHMVGQLHSGRNKGGSTSNHITYCTPAWYLLEEIKKEFKYADFYRTTWQA